MKRQALLIGNLDANGALIDINNWKKYLQSGVGGFWKESEIIVLADPTKAFLQTWLDLIRLSKNDFVLVAFAGHGNWTRRTNLYINPQEEYISESELKNLSPRQIICLDCCRGVSNIPDSVNETYQKVYSESKKIIIRNEYDSRMMQANIQQVTLYACEIGESAYCTKSGGGYYTKNLLLRCSNQLNNKYLTINSAHDIASVATTQEVKQKEGKDQHPDISAVRCPSGQQLIVGICPELF